MATILLSAAGAALGAGFGGTVLGLSGAVIGRAVGATLGRAIDQRLLGAGSEPVETGRVERFRLMGASEGTAISQVWGRARVAGQVIWATEFLERSSTSGGGKGSPSPTVTSYAYSVSLALALCEGEITRVGRVWADGLEIEAAQLNLRVYPGSQTQLPDPKIEAVEGPDYAPSYRGIAYVVIEDLDLTPFGNRVPQLSFEVLRRARGALASAELDLADCVTAVCMIPGTGEYAYATTPVHFSDGPGVNRSANVNTILGGTDFSASLLQMREELPQVGSVSLVISWFGNDLRCQYCEVRPKVEQALQDGEGMPWRSGGVTRGAAAVVPQLDGLSVYGGTPADASVIEAIRAVRDGGQEVMFYPFILMDQLADNDLVDPYTGTVGQPPLPWRGRITLTAAPGRAGSSDRTLAAEAEVATFFGTAQIGDFSVSDGQVSYSGPQDWGYRRFILHYAHLCAAAGGVDAFCIGSELRGLTQIRGAGDSFPVVAALAQLAADVRAVLGSETRLTYAADWSEYFGYHTGDNVYFHLDPLWADPNIDFVGIDNYAPLADWRDGESHADVGWGSTYDIGYLKANIAGGEGFDWYYNSPEGEAAQLRTPITDGAYGEPWVFRFKDLKSWWQNPHFNRIGGVRQPNSTGWVPQSKPFLFTEYGCAAIDKGANQPNKFLDPKSSESGLPRASSGRRDDLMQMAYLRAMREFWTDPANNPVSALTGAPMLDMARSHVWTWDARPFPAFPNLPSLWSDAENYAHGHWLNGRAGSQPLARVIAEICERAQVQVFDVSNAYGIVRGFSVAEIGSARSALQVLSLAHATEVIERDGILRFLQRDAWLDRVLDPGRFAVSADLDGTYETIRAASAETLGRVRISFVEAEGDFAVRTSEALFPDDSANVVSDNDLPLLLTASEARDMAERWLAESRVARDRARFALPPSASDLGASDTVQIGAVRYRIDRVEQGESLLIDAVRVEPGSYVPGEEIIDPPAQKAYAAPLPVYPLFLDLPLLAGDEVEHAPHVAITGSPWPGSVAVWSAPADEGYVVNRVIDRRASIGVTETDLLPAPSGLWDRGPSLRVKMLAGDLASAEMDAVLNGANAAAIGDGVTDTWEVLQFAEAVLVAPATYEIRLRLRGQAGTDAATTGFWPSGSRFVLLTSDLQQIDLATSARGLSRYYRIGDASRPYDDPNVIVEQRAFAGVGLRPYGVAHLRHVGAAGEDLSVTWIRRTRLDGDSWESLEVPLGEDREAYVVRVLQGDTPLRETEVTTPTWTYSPADQDADGATTGFVIAVAQLSDRFGPGPFRTVTVS